MAQMKEVRTQINSIKNTQKITSAMELVAASKMRAAKDLMTLTKPYAEKIREVIAHVAGCSSEYQHPFLLPRKNIKRVGYIIVSSDRGLCGGLNMNCFKLSLQEMRKYSAQEIAIDLCLIGHKAELFFSRVGGNVLAIASHLGNKPKAEELIGLVKVMLDKFSVGELDAVYLISNDFVNTMVQKPVMRQLLPLREDDAALQKNEKNKSDSRGHWDYIYEPDSAREILDILLKRYIESQVYQAVVENMACFQAAQMIAMKNATENANEIIDELELIYNKARQAGITQEIAEVVGGAAAIE
jgi:F-type H+-transporting ATPase subunit gamma